jgi:hypothetical protein
MGGWDWQTFYLSFFTIFLEVNWSPLPYYAHNKVLYTGLFSGIGRDCFIHVLAYKH